MDDTLNSLINRLKVQWSELQENWSDPTLQLLYESAQKLERLSDVQKENQLNEACFSFEVYLSTFVGNNIRPDDQQILKINNLLSDIAQLQLSTDADEDTNKNKQFIAYFGGYDLIPSDFPKYCSEQNWIFSIFHDPASLSSTILSNKTTALLIDSRSAEEIAPVISELKKTQGNHNISLAIISPSDDVSSRLQARKMGIPLFLTATDDSVALFSSLKKSFATNEGCRVLVVEDDPAQADFVAAILNSAGYSTRIVIDPLTVIDIADNYSPDLFMIDLYMPGINGAELTAILREKQEYHSTPIILLSGEQETDIQRNALQQGANEFITISVIT